MVLSGRNLEREKCSRNVYDREAAQIVPVKRYLERKDYGWEYG